MAEAALTSQNWEALLRLELRGGKDKTHLVPIERYGPLSVQRPFYPEQEVCHVYLLHPPGGIVGGDKLDLHLDLKTDAKALFTTPGAAKFYLSAGDTAHVTQRFEVADGARLEFLPQENIYFPGAQVKTRTSIDVQADGRVMLWEKHCFGRPANEEFFATGNLVSQIELWTEGQLIYAEKQRIDAEEIKRPSGLRKHAVIGSFIVYGTSFDKPQLARLQELKPRNGICGVTQPHPGLLIARYLGDSTSDADACFVRLWEIMRPLVMQRDISRPRIWNT